MKSFRSAALPGLLLALWAVLALTACATSPATPAPSGGTQAAFTMTVPPATSTGAVGIGPAETTVSAPESEPPYLDDRSTAETLMHSFVNALNLRQYSRAYSYWEKPLRPFDLFVEGYADTQSVALTLGEIGVEAGAGQRYFSVPVILTAQTSTETQFFVGCYVLHLSHPDLQATPPFRPLAIQSAEVAQVESAAEAQARLPEVCATP